MGHSLEPSGLGFRWLLVPISVGLILVLSYWNTVAAQPIKDRRLRPAAPIPVNQAPHLSEKEQYKRWRSEQDNRNRVKLRTEPLRAANEVSAETLLINEGFEGVTFPPVGWTSQVVAGAPDWVRSSGSWHTGSFGAYSEFGADANLAIKYLITKRIPVKSALLYNVTFWARRGFSDPFDPDTLYIKLSTTDSLPGSFTTTLFKCYTGPDTAVTNPHIYISTMFKQFFVSFTGISGNIWLAFDHEDKFGQSIDLDDVQVKEIVNNDMAAVTVDEPTSNAKQNLGVSFQPKGTFRNDGVLTQTSIPVRFKIYNAGGSVVYNDTKTISSLARDVTAQVTFNSFTPSTPGNYIARIFAQNPGDTNPANDSTEVSFRIRDDISGVKTVGSGGNFETLTDAVRYLNDNNVAGPLTFSLIGTTYTEEPLSIEPISYTTTIQPVLFQPSSGVSATVTILCTPAKPYGIRIKQGASLTINGSNNNSSTRDLTIVIDTSGFFSPAVLLTNGCKNVVLKNTTVRGYGKPDGSANYVVAVDTTLAGQKDSNLVFENLHLVRGFDGFFLRGPSTKSFKITVMDCDIGGLGNDAIIQAGVEAYNIDSLTVQNTSIHDLASHQSLIPLIGIFLGDKCGNAILNSNKIYTLRHSVNSLFAQGVVSFAGNGSNLLCFNNFIYDIRSSGSGVDPNVSFAFYSGQTNTGDRYYYNSINLFGNDSSTSIESFSTGFWFDDGISSVQTINNIVKNSMTFAGLGVGNKAYGIYVPSSIWPSGSTSNRNDLYPSGPQGAVGFFNALNRITLGNWQSAVAQDANSLSADPFFVSNADLHIQTDSASPVNGKATPIPGISHDIDGNNRNASTPDIGADEFVSASGVVGNLNANWNMISLPVDVIDPGVAAVFPSGLSSPIAFAYTGEYVPRDVLVPSTGYWVQFNSPQTVVAEGLPRESDTVNVSSGWNLIGTLSVTVPTSAVTSLSAGTISSRFFGYGGSYFPADSLYPWKAYWVMTSQAGQLLMAKTSSASTKNQASDELSQFNRLTVQDASGNPQHLYFGWDDTNVDIGLYEMPPLPPSGSFDARFASGRMLDLARGNGSFNFPIHISSPTYPVTIRWEVNQSGRKTMLVVGRNRIRMASNGSVEITNSTEALEVVVESGSGIPKEFSLNQNFPNPFNPSTVIRYSLPVNSHVVLKIYNVLGQEVKTLVDEIRDAGYESVEWDASKISSGIYFYKLEAVSVTDAKQSFVQLKKALLLK